MATAIITGTNGYIGTHLVNLLLNKRYDIIGIDNCLVGHEPIEQFSNNKRFTLIRGDICDPRVWDKAMEKGNVDYVFHLAGIVGDPACLNNLQRSFEINVTATELCAKMCQKYGVKKLCFASSCSCYGQMIKLPPAVIDLVEEIKPGFKSTKVDNLIKEIEHIAKLELDETSSTNPIDFYGMTKLAGERVIAEVLPKNRYVFARFGTAYGLNSARMRFDLVVNTMTLKAFYQGKVEIYGHGDQRRPFTHCEDLARAMVYLAEKDVSGVFNIVSENFQIKDIAESVREVLPETEIGFKRSMEDWRDYNVSNKKLLATGFKFKHTVKSSIKQMVDELKQWKYEDYADDKYYNVKLKY